MFSDNAISEYEMQVHIKKIPTCKLIIYSRLKWNRYVKQRIRNKEYICLDINERSQSQTKILRYALLNLCNWFFNYPHPKRSFLHTHVFLSSIPSFYKSVLMFIPLHLWNLRNGCKYSITYTYHMAILSSGINSKTTRNTHFIMSSFRGVSAPVRVLFKLDIYIQC